MKGIGKAFSRTPHLLTTKVGMSKKSLDPEYEDYSRNFAALEVETEKLLKDTTVFTEAVVNLFTASQGWATHFSAIFHPISGEFDLIGRHPEAADTVRNVAAHQQAMEELQSAIAPELELIESRISAPVKEFQGVLKSIRKTMTKREHKLVDYDRFNNSLTKLRDKKEKTLSDEKNLFKLEQDFEAATNDYDFINTTLKTDLPHFLQLATRFIDPLFHSFFYMQLNIYYMLLEKMQGFAEGRYDITNVPGSQIAADYEAKRSDAWEVIEGMSIVSRMVSTQKLVQTARGLSPGSALDRKTSTSSTGSRGVPPGVGRTNSTLSTAAAYKKAPPPPPGASIARSPSAVSAAPPPYTAGGSAASALAGKKAPPPPPLKPKPAPPPPAATYVVALYDFVAQAEGDLSFNTGDRIEIIERTASPEDWWTGRLNGQQGVFPGNYVQDT